MCCWPKWDHLQGFKGYNFFLNLFKVLKDNFFKKNSIAKNFIGSSVNLSVISPCVKLWDVKVQIEGPIWWRRIDLLKRPILWILINFQYKTILNSIFFATWVQKFQNHDHHAHRLIEGFSIRPKAQQGSPQFGGLSYNHKQKNKYFNIIDYNPHHFTSTLDPWKWIYFNIPNLILEPKEDHTMLQKTCIP